MPANSTQPNWGLPLTSESPQALVFGAGQTPLRITLVQEVAVAPYTVLGWTVEDIRAAVPALGSKGIEFHLLSLTQPAQM